MYDLFEAEANGALAQGLVLPAYDYLLKCSHTFNVLDTRGAIGVTERQAFFRRMRELARKVAESYKEQRERLEYPLLKSTEKLIPSKEVSSNPVLVSQPSDFVLEIGVEELPASDVDWAIEQLKLFFEQKILKVYSLQYKSVKA